MFMFFKSRPRFRVAVASTQGYSKNPFKNEVSPMLKEQLQTVMLRDGQERSMHAETIAMQVFL